MVGGFNTNVRYRGRVFHVQTEDTGPQSSRVVVTLVYEGGVILSSKKTSYDAAIHAVERQKIVRELMESQHADVVRALKSGELDGSLRLRPAAGGAAAGRGAAPPSAGAEPSTRTGPQSFGAGVITDRPLDRVVLAHLGLG